MMSLPTGVLAAILQLCVPRRGRGRRWSELQKVCRQWRRVLRSPAFLAADRWEMAGVDASAPPADKTSTFDATAMLAARSDLFCSFVFSLDLSYATMTQEVLDMLPAAFPRLKVLRLQNTLMRVGAACPLLLDPLSALASLEELDVSKLVFGTRESGFAVARYSWRQGFSPLLRTFRRSGIGELGGLDEELRGSTALGLREIITPHIQSVNGWHDTWFGEDELPLLVLLVARSPQLEVLDLSGWFPGSWGYANEINSKTYEQELFSILAKRSAPLKLLRLRRCRPLGPGLQKLAECIDTDESPMLLERNLINGLRRSLEEIATLPFVSLKGGKWTMTPPVEEKTAAPDGFFANLGRVELAWAWEDRKDGFDFISFGGRLNIPDLQWPLKADHWNDEPAVCFDNMVAEGTGYLILPDSGRQDNLYISWETSTSTVRFKHRFMTVREYLEFGSRCGFSWYWPVSMENRWICLRLLWARHFEGGDEKRMARNNSRAINQ